MGCFNCGGCRGNNGNNCDRDRREREIREAYLAGFREGCKNAPCRWLNDNDNNSECDNI